MAVSVVNNAKLQQIRMLSGYLADAAMHPAVDLIALMYRSEHTRRLALNKLIILQGRFNDLD